MNKYLKRYINNTFKKPGKALDLGAGNFFEVDYLNTNGWQCDGVDKKIDIDLENPYLSPKAPLDLVYSCYVLQFIKNKRVFVKTVYDNLRTGGRFYILAMHKFDKICKSNLTIDLIKKLLTDRGFKNVKIKLFDHYDKHPNHKHWHRVLEVCGEK